MLFELVPFHRYVDTVIANRTVSEFLFFFVEEPNSGILGGNVGLHSILSRTIGSSGSSKKLVSAFAD